MTWLANIHSSMFYNMYQFIFRQRHAAAERLLPVRRQVRGARPRQQERLCVRAVPPAVSCGQGAGRQARGDGYFERLGTSETGFPCR
jgi:hypothetical protein